MLALLRARMVTISAVLTTPSTWISGPASRASVQRDIGLPVARTDAVVVVVELMEVSEMATMGWSHLGA